MRKLKGVMKPRIFLFMLGVQFLTTSAWGGAFRYDGADGKCKDKNGNPGYNKISLSQLIKNGDAECGTFGSLGVTLNPGEIPSCKKIPCQLNAWNFRGADLNTLRASGGPYCGLDFINSDLRGAQMNELAVIYTCFAGTIDSFTVYEDKICQLNENQIRCIR